MKGLTTLPKYAELATFKEQNLIPEYNGEMLHREVRALAISRLEESARTEADFHNVISWWDTLDSNRERKERAHEIGRSEIPLEWGASEYYLPANASYDMVLQNLLLAGDFIDYIYDQPDNLHELVTTSYISGILKSLKASHKQLMFYLFVHAYSTVQYAALNNQTDRNVRGVRETALKKIRKELTKALEYRKEHDEQSLTPDEKYFLENGVRRKSDMNLKP